MNKLSTLILRSLNSEASPLDSYQAAKQAGCSPMLAGRTLLDLEKEGLVRRRNVGGDQPLAEEFVGLARISAQPTQP